MDQPEITTVQPSSNPPAINIPPNLNRMDDVIRYKRSTSRVKVLLGTNLGANIFMIVLMLLYTKVFNIQVESVGIVNRIGTFYMVSCGFLAVLHVVSMFLFLSSSIARFASLFGSPIWNDPGCSGLARGAVSAVTLWCFMAFCCCFWSPFLARLSEVASQHNISSMQTFSQFIFSHVSIIMVPSVFHLCATIAPSWLVNLRDMFSKDP